MVPALYGFLPQTYCGDLVAEYCMAQTQRTDIHGDGDPLDICVLTEKTISHGDIVAEVRPLADSGCWIRMRPMIKLLRC